MSGHRIAQPLPEHLSSAVFGLGCFWGAERLFWQLEGVYSTAVGYAGGITANPSYEDVCSGRTGHAEVVIVFFDPSRISYRQLLSAFWEAHDPTQGMRQGNDVGTQYRSAIYTFDAEQLEQANSAARVFQPRSRSEGIPRSLLRLRRSTHFIMPTTTISNILRKTLMAIAGSQALALAIGPTSEFAPQEFRNWGVKSDSAAECQTTVD